MTKQRSQLDKWNERMAKLKLDEKVVIEAKMENEIESSTLTKTGEKIAKDHGVSTEDIFAIITRESMGSFMTLWNNSMETVLKDTMRTEMKEMVRTVMREEMAEAYRGILKGIATSKTEEPIIEKVEEIVYDKLVAAVETEKVVEKTKVRKHDKTPKPYKDKLDELILLAKAKGVDPAVGSKFSELGGSYITVYQKFMAEHKGIRGAWKEYVTNFLKQQ